ncbi:cytochrome B [Moraxellaceae bacterium AER2_44_116]|nr:YceI family protein [Moraxellaceae bacterium]TQC98172.1 cytochrome B [Moraxellaceae bacterium AER2_44_116]
MNATRNRYTNVAIILHWLIAAAIIFQMVLGWRLGDAPKGAATYALFQLHKSIGFTILFLSLARLAWRFMHTPPALPSHMKAWEKTASHLVHIGFYGIMLGLPLTGWLLVSTSKINIPTVLFGVMPMPHLPFLSELAVTTKAMLNDAAGAGHGLLALLTCLLLLLHVGAVLKHQVIVKDNVFARMAVGARAGITEPRLWLVGMTGLLVMWSAYVYMPTLKAKAIPVVAVEAEETVTATEVTEQPASVDKVASTMPSVAAETKPTPVDAVPVLATETVKTMPLSHWLVSKNAQLGFATQWTGEPVVGSFKQWTADIVFSPDDLKNSSLTVKVDLASVATGDEQRDSALPSADWFDVANHPTAIFKASRFTRVAEGSYKADGTLSLRDKTAPIVLSFKLNIDGDKATAKGSTTLDRNVFGVGQGEFSATDQIPAAVKVSFNLTAMRKP